MKPSYSKGIIFCNNKCAMSDMCFRYLPSHTKSADLFDKNKDKTSTIQCNSYIEWLYKNKNTSP